VPAAADPPQPLGAELLPEELSRKAQEWFSGKTAAAFLDSIRDKGEGEDAKPWEPKDPNPLKPAGPDEVARARQQRDEAAQAERLAKLGIKKGKGPDDPLRIGLPREPQRGDWEEGELLPRGWERMNAMEKVTQVLYGKRGFLFWLNWLAFRSVFVLLGLWIFFRFIGPATGLYALKDAWTPPDVF